MHLFWHWTNSVIYTVAWAYHSTYSVFKTSLSFMGKCRSTISTWKVFRFNKSTFHSSSIGWQQFLFSRSVTDSIKRLDSNERFVHDPEELGDDTSAILSHGCCNPQKSSEIFLAVRSLYSDSVRVLEQFQHVDAVCGARGCETVRRKAQKKACRDTV